MNTSSLSDIGTIPTCMTCGSTNVVVDAFATWNVEAGFYELETTFDRAHCKACDGPTTLVWSEAQSPNTARIAELNDLFRKEGIGTGSVLITAGIQALGAAVVQQVVDAVRTYDAFDSDNDPWGERDFGAIELEGEKVFFKIDPYNLDCSAGSENPANAGVTHRVLTIMLASEY